MSEQLLVKAFRTSETLVGNCAVSINNDGTVKMAKTANDTVIGIALPGGNLAENASADILLVGITNAKAGAALQAGDALFWNGDGQFVKATGTQKSVAIALESVGANGLARVLLRG